MWLAVVLTKSFINAENNNYDDAEPSGTPRLTSVSHGVKMSSKCVDIIRPIMVYV